MMEDHGFDEDDLLLHYYGEGLSAAAQEKLNAALRDDPALAARYRELAAFLDGVGRGEPAAAGALQHARWHAAISRPADAAGPARRGAPPLFAWSLAAAILLGLGAILGAALRGPVTTGADTPPEQQIAFDASEAFARGLRAHLRRSKFSLVSADAGEETERARLAGEIVAQNRLFERAAARQDLHDFARVLRAIEPILVELSGDGITPVQAERLKSQLDFELDVVLTKLAREPSTLSETI